MVTPHSLELSTNSRQDHVCLKVDKKLIKVSLASVLYIESLKDYIRVKTLHDDFITNCTLSNFTSQLTSQNFIRSHRSYTVAIDKIVKIDANAIIAGNYIPVSRNRKQQVLERFLPHHPEV